MAKRTIRVAWGLAMVLGLIVLTGIGTLLSHGVSFPGRSMRMAPPGAMRANVVTISEHPDFWKVTRCYDLCFCQVVVSRNYYQTQFPAHVGKELGLQGPLPRRKAAPH